MSRVEARRLDRGSRDAALRLLARDPIANLLLIDTAGRLGEVPAPGETPPEMVGAWQDGELVAVGSLRPSIAFSAAPPEVLSAFLPHPEPIGVGMIKSSTETVNALWNHLGRSPRRRVVLDRRETTYVVRASEARLAPVRAQERVRNADLDDLEPLIVAARESLREEDRPDPFAGDIRGFRRWVRGRVPRARVVESGGTIACVGYADIRLRVGWLVQGVYCWPEVRRLGFAKVAVSDLCREAFAAGAEHVQLAVVEGNAAAHRLYSGLGFHSCGSLRTILFG
jgi:RimJ/RimL family protein N-acetyltransferase